MQVRSHACVRKCIGVLVAMGVLAGCGGGVRPTPAVTSCSAPAPTKGRTNGARELDWPVWIGVVCDDFEAQRHFYRDVLGLQEHVTSVDTVWFDFDGRQLELFAKSELPQYARRGVAVGFVVKDIREARRKLLERGVAPVSEIDGAFGQHWAYFKDADGNLFEIVERGRR